MKWLALLSLLLLAPFCGGGGDEYQWPSEWLPNTTQTGPLSCTTAPVFKASRPHFVRSNLGWQEPPACVEATCQGRLISTPDGTIVENCAGFPGETTGGYYQFSAAVEGDPAFPATIATHDITWRYKQEVPGCELEPGETFELSQNPSHYSFVFDLDDLPFASCSLSWADKPVDDPCSDLASVNFPDWWEVTDSNGDPFCQGSSSDQDCFLNSPPFVQVDRVFCTFVGPDP